jgi:hypothetical protein
VSYNQTTFDYFTREIVACWRLLIKFAGLNKMASPRHTLRVVLRLTLNRSQKLPGLLVASRGGFNGTFVLTYWTDQAELRLSLDAKVL